METGFSALYLSPLSFFVFFSLHVFALSTIVAVSSSNSGLHAFTVSSGWEDQKKNTAGWMYCGGRGGWGDEDSRVVQDEFSRLIPLSWTSTLTQSWSWINTQLDLLRAHTSKRSFLARKKPWQFFPNSKFILKGETMKRKKILCLHLLTSIAWGQVLPVSV